MERMTHPFRNLRTAPRQASDHPLNAVQQPDRDSSARSRGVESPLCGASRHRGRLASLHAPARVGRLAYPRPMPDREPGRWPTVDKDERARGFAKLRSLQLREAFSLTPAQRIRQLDDLITFERVLAARRPLTTAEVAPRQEDAPSWRERRRR